MNPLWTILFEEEVWLKVFSYTFIGQTWGRSSPCNVAVYHTNNYSHQIFGCAGHEIKNLDMLPEGQGEVCDICVTLSDQEGGISTPSLCAVIVDQSLGHQPALLHVTMKPWL